MKSGVPPNCFIKKERKGSANQNRNTTVTDIRTTFTRVEDQFFDKNLRIERNNFDKVQRVGYWSFRSPLKVRGLAYLSPPYVPGSLLKLFPPLESIQIIRDTFWPDFTVSKKLAMHKLLIKLRGFYQIISLFCLFIC